MSSFYSSLGISSTDFSSKSLVGKVYYLKNEFERAVGEREDLRKNRDYWQAEEHKERVKADQLEAKIYQEDDCKII